MTYTWIRGSGTDFITDMSLELILQLLVLPGLGYIMLQIQRLEVKLSVHIERVRELENRLEKIEDRLEQNL